MGSVYPRDRDWEIRAFAARRGLSGEIRLPERAERSPVEILGPRAGTMRQMGEDPRTVRDASDRGAGEAKAAAERQPQRGMFDGFRPAPQHPAPEPTPAGERKKARSEEHTSELQSLMRISYAVFCLKKKND